MPGSKTKASSDQTDIFIHNLQHFPAIWDSTSPIFHNRDATLAAWQALADKAELSVQDAKKVYSTHRKYFSAVSWSFMIIFLLTVEVCFLIVTCS